MNASINYSVTSRARQWRQQY